MIWRYGLIIIVSYLLGSISTGVLLTKNLDKNIMEEGSHSSGATNAMRVFGKKIGIATFVGDFIKSALSILFGCLLVGHPYGAMVAVFFAIIGHSWPVFFGFKGGKGIACSSAAMFLLFPIEGIIAHLVFALVLFTTKYVSLGSLLMLSSYALLLTITHGFWPFGAWALLLTACAFYRHKANIHRLMNGTENKSFSKKK